MVDISTDNTRSLDLLNQLRSGDAAMRQNAAYHLAFIGNHDSIPVLLHALRDPDLNVQQMAVFAINELGLGDTIYSDMFLSLLRDTIPFVRRFALSCIHRLKNDNVDLTKIVIQLLYDPDDEVRTEAAWVLRRTDGDSLCKVLAAEGLSIEKSISYLNTASSIHAQITSILGMIQHGLSSLTTLEKTLTHKDPVIRRATILALGKINGDTVTTLLEQSLTDDDPEVRSYAALELGNIGGDKSMMSLISMLEDKDDAVRADVAHALSRIDTESSTKTRALIKHLSDKDESVVLSCVLALGTRATDKRDIMNALLPALNHPNLLVRSQALSSLMQLAPQASTTLLALNEQVCNLKSYIPSEYFEALLNYLSGSTSTDTITTFGRLLKDENFAIRILAAMALTDYVPYSHIVLTELSEALFDQDSIVRLWAASALENLRIQSEPALPSLILALKDKDWGVRAASARAIGNIGRSAVGAERPLREATNDPELVVRFFAAIALLHIRPTSPFPIPILLDCAKHSSDAVHRRVTIRTLAELPILTNEISEFLLQCVRDSDDEVRESAEKVLLEKTKERSE